MKSKTIIISSPIKENSGRGILTLYIEDELLKCKLRLYNVNKLSKYCKLGIYHKDEVSSANLIERDGVYYSSLVGDFNLDLDFYCAIIDTAENNSVILAGGTYAGFYFNDNSVFEKETPLPEQELKNTPNCEENSPNCANCKYKEFFYSNSNKINVKESENLFVAAKDAPSSTVTEQEPRAIPTIIDSIIPQFDYIFKNYEQNEELSNLIENSKFVKMNEGEYSLGAIYENENIKYICYAVKVNYNTPAPEELGKHYQWLPLDKEDPLSDGYYLVFQDANDLKIIDV